MADAAELGPAWAAAAVDPPSPGQPVPVARCISPVPVNRTANPAGHPAAGPPARAARRPPAVGDRRPPAGLAARRLAAPTWPPQGRPPQAWPPGTRLPPGVQLPPNGQIDNPPPGWPAVPGLPVRRGGRPRPHGMRSALARTCGSPRVSSTSSRSVLLSACSTATWSTSGGRRHPATGIRRGRSCEAAFKGASVPNVTPTMTSRGNWLSVAILLLAIGIWLAYEVPNIASSGQTPGKRLMGIRVVAAGSDDTGSAYAGPSAAGCRWACRCSCGPAARSASCFGGVLQLIDCLSPTHQPPAAPGPARSTRVHRGRPDRHRIRRRPPRVGVDGAFDGSWTARRRWTRRHPPRRITMTQLTRPDLDLLPTYVPGRIGARRDQAGEQRGAVRPAARRRRGDHRRPPQTVAPLPGHGRRRAARRRSPSGTASTAERVATGCGSVAMAEHLARATCVRRRRDRVLVALVRGVPDHRGDHRRDQRAACRTPPTHGHDLDAMAAAVTDRTRMILVCNPNNPTGTALRRAELDAFLDAVPDERAGRAGRGLPRVRHRPDRARTPSTAYADRPNVVVLRTLSKAWGMAGLRVGFIVGAPEVATTVRKVITPFSTSSVAQAAALAALDQVPEMERRARSGDRRTRHGCWPRFASSSRTCPESQANFVWLPLGDGVGRVRAAPARPRA